MYYFNKLIMMWCVKYLGKKNVMNNNINYAYFFIKDE